ncbi:hypothetical protein BH23GEM11_BH23GEM11_04180 [soil metagenome]
MERLELDIDGMSCDHCTRAVSGALEGTRGVKVERVDIGSAVLAFDPATVSPEEITKAVEEEGYTVRRASQP